MSVSFTEFWRGRPDHYCNHVIDPSICCPCGHGEEDERFCTCKVSGELAEAVRNLDHQLYLETYRELENGRMVLKKHKLHMVQQSVRGIYRRVECRLKSGSAAIGDDNICPMCKELIDCKL